MNQRVALRSRRAIAPCLTACLIALAFAGCSIPSANVLPTSHPTATATALPTATPAPKVLYQDSLKDFPSGWDKGPYSWDCRFKSDGLHALTDDNCSLALSNAAENISGNFTVTVTVKLLQEGTFDELFGITISDFFFLTPDGQWVVLGTKENGQWGAVLPYAQSSVIHAGVGASNTLKVQIHTTMLTFYINGTLVGTLAHQPLTKQIWSLGAIDEVASPHDPSYRGVPTDELVYTNLLITAP